MTDRSPNAEGEGAGTGPAPSLRSGAGPTLHDDHTDLELQMDLDEIERSEKKDASRALLLLGGLVAGLAISPGDTAALGLVMLIVLLVGTAMGFARVRRTQGRRAIEAALEQRRERHRDEADTSALRLAALHDELDRLSAERGRGVEVLLSSLGAIIFILIGLTEGIPAAWGVGVFFGLFAAVRGRGELDRRAELQELRDAIEDVERERSVRPAGSSEEGDESPGEADQLSAAE